MGEKATIFQTVQLGVQTIQGTPVATNKKLLATSLVPGPRVESDSFRAMGNKYASFATLNKEWSEAKASGKLTYNEILYLLVSLLSQPTPTLQGTTAYKWVFTSNTAAEDVGKFLTVEQGDANSAWRVSDLRMSGLTLTFNRKEVGLSGTGIALPMETGITMTASPTSLSPLPVLPAHLSFAMADTQAGLAAATPLTRGFGMEWALTDKFNLAWPVGQNPVALETKPGLQAKLKLATDTVGLGLFTTMRGGATKWFRIKAEGATIETTYKNTFQIDFPGQITDVSEFSDEDGVYLMEYTLLGIHDATWNKSFQIDVINTLSTL